MQPIARYIKTIRCTVSTTPFVISGPRAISFHISVSRIVPRARHVLARRRIFLKFRLAALLNTHTTTANSSQKSTNLPVTKETVGKAVRCNLNYSIDYLIEII